MGERERAILKKGAIQELRDTQKAQEAHARNAANTINHKLLMIDIDSLADLDVEGFRAAVDDLIQAHAEYLEAAAKLEALEGGA